MSTSTHWYYIININIRQDTSEKCHIPSTIAGIQHSDLTAKMIHGTSLAHYLYNDAWQGR